MINRWLSLEKPFQYDNMLVVRKFNLVKFLTVNSNVVFTSLKNILFETDYCIEIGFGFMYPRSSISHIVLLPATSLSRICMDVCILLISKQLLHMRFRLRNKASDRHFKQSAKYVVVTCILFHTCFVEYMLVLEYQNILGQDNFQVLNNWLLFQSCLIHVTEF